jgi:hypothetical protein
MTNMLAYNISVTMTALKVFMARALEVNASDGHFALYKNIRLG